jgi:SAM-dependent methyltransferase
MQDTAKTDEGYWTGLWSATALPPPFDPTSADYLGKRYHEVFERHLPKSNGELELLELGCGTSRWLPYFARHFGFRVSGLDYSEVGCNAAREILNRDGVTGTVLHGDVFNPASDFENRFDVVISLGLVEHFRDTGSALRSFARFAKPGGLVVTTVPNMAGWQGVVQKHLINRSVYDGHEPLDLERLEAAHRDAGLVRVAAGPVGILDFHNLNVGVPEGRKEIFWVRLLIYKILTRLSRIIWALDSVVKIPVSTRTAAAFYYVAQKPIS